MTSRMDSQSSARSLASAELLVRARCRALAVTLMAAVAWVSADSPFATEVVEFSPAPGQLVNVPQFNDPSRALGPPVGGGTHNADNSKIVSLGGFGGVIVLRFDHTVVDDPANPFCVDAIVFGNAFWVGHDPNRHWAECACIEISRDSNGNGLPDDPWYLIPGSHLSAPLDLTTQTWDDDLPDMTYPPYPVEPEFPYQDWIPPGSSGVWDTQVYRLPSAVFDTIVLANPNGPGATVEGVFGYGDFAPVLILGDLDGDNVVDDPALAPEDFYTIPNDPLTVGIAPGSGGGDAFDIGWAVDPDTGLPADIDGFDFIRISNGVNHVTPNFGELSPEIGGVADVAAGLLGDGDWDGDIDVADLDIFANCTTGPAGNAEALGCHCRTMDFDDDGDVDTNDFAEWQTSFTG